MQDLVVVRVIYVRKDAEELPVDVFDRRREGLVECMIWNIMK
jgi:hypothetical protein